MARQRTTSGRCGREVMAMRGAGTRVALHRVEEHPDELRVRYTRIRGTAGLDDRGETFLSGSPYLLYSRPRPPTRTGQAPHCVLSDFLARETNTSTNPNDRHDYQRPVTPDPSLHLILVH